jgi:hypothetical protein
MTRSVAALFVALIASAEVITSAQSPAPMWTPVIEYRQVLALPSGDQATKTGAVPLPLGGQPVTFGVMTSPDLCGTGGPTEELAVDVALLSVDGRGVRAQVSSRFVKSATANAPTPWSQVITFKEGDEITLETMRANADGPCHARNLTIRAKIVLKANDPVAQAARYVADLWLVHDTGVGQSGVGSRRSLSVAINLSSAGPTAFAFAPLGFELPQLSPHQGDLQLCIDLSGSLRARLRPDGMIDLDVSTTRMFALRHPADDPGPTRGSMGTKTLTLKEDETVAMDLPIGNGVIMHALTPDARFSVNTGARPGAAAAETPRPTVSVKDDRMTVDFEQFFKGQKTQLLVRLRKARE